MMKLAGSQAIIQEYFAFLNHKDYPCMGAKAALSKEQIQCIVVRNMADSKDDPAILMFLYDFVDTYRRSKEPYLTATILFRQPQELTEELFDELLWKKLQALSDLDAENYPYDPRVNADPGSPDFSFSLKEEAFFIVGLNPSSSRLARRFKYPALVFNLHDQFEYLRNIHQYEDMKRVIRKRDLKYSGSVNPMLADFGESPEVSQYSGRRYDSQWECPLKIRHGLKTEKKHSPAK